MALKPAVCSPSRTRALSLVMMSWAVSGFSLCGAAATCYSAFFNNGGTAKFLADNVTSILNSIGSQHKVALLNHIGLAAADAFFSGQREIRVEDNPASANNFAVIDSVISSSKAGVGIQKTGPGLLEFAAGGTYSYTGPTIVSSGALRLNGSVTGGGSLTVAGDAVIAGIGTISGAVLAPGSIAPSNSIGTLVGGSVTWNGRAANAWRYELGNGSTSASLPKSRYGEMFCKCGIIH
ncbi:MAG: hypothetical protein ABI600_10135 [Luteolibacter sp.]